MKRYLTIALVVALGIGVLSMGSSMFCRFSNFSSGETMMSRWF